MNADAKQLWLDDLLSGDYVQGTGSLIKVDSEGNEKHCCLGVACKTYDKQHPGDIEFQVHHTGYVIAVDENYDYLPKKVQAWLDLNDCDPLIIFPEIITMKGKADSLITESRYWTLSAINDAGFDFTQIADIVRYFL